MNAPSFHDLIRRVRTGDADAATELVRKYEPAIRRAVRIRLADTRLQRILDSTDVCQSVLASFFVRAASGQYELDQPEQLLKLLATMARNKVVNQARRERTQGRDHRRVEATGLDVGEFVDPGTSPALHAVRKELVEELHRRLSVEDRQLLELRNHGMEWAAIAEQIGGSAEALRKQLARAVDEAARELGVDETE